jgi:hypothetical protein
VPRKSTQIFTTNAADLGFILSGRVAFSPQEFGALFGRSKTWTYRLVYAGIIHPLRSTPSLMIPRSEVDRLLADTAEYDGRPIVKPRRSAKTKASARPPAATRSRSRPTPKILP